MAFAQQAIRTVLFASMPMLLLSLIVGLLVSVIQAVTQIQEATLS
ncbi:flagellar biosynthetic protein FliQ, partial [Bacillus licheniformis]